MRIGNRNYPDSTIAIAMSEATGWNPEIGDTVEGIVLGAKLGWSDVSDSEYPIVFVLPDGKDVTEEGVAVAIHCFQKVLQNEMTSQRPERGDRLFCTRRNDREASRKGWNPVQVFAVLITKPDGGSRSIWDAPTASPTVKVPATQNTGSNFTDEPPF
jgi:hypothetical protein